MGSLSEYPEPYELKHLPQDIFCHQLTDVSDVDERGFNAYKYSCNERIKFFTGEGRKLDESAEVLKGCASCEYGIKVAHALNVKLLLPIECAVCGDETEDNKKHCRKCLDKIKQKRLKYIETHGLEEHNRKRRERRKKARENERD